MQQISSPSSQDVLNIVRSHAGDVLLVLIGFDGVLADYTGDPHAVRLPRPRRELLRRLVRAGAAVGIVSGRRVRDLRSRTGLGAGVYYIGLHGLEVVGPGFTRIEQHTIDEYREPLHEIALRLEPAVARVAGVSVEDKEGAIALHTRNAGSEDAIWARLHMLNTAADVVSTQAFRVVRGNHVLELVPNVGDIRAHAITELQTFLERVHRRPVFTVYVGEDVPDDDARAAVAGHGIAAVVGRRARHADYHLDSIEAVHELMTQLASAWAVRG